MWIQVNFIQVKRIDYLKDFKIIIILLMLSIILKNWMDRMLRFHMFMINFGLLAAKIKHWLLVINLNFKKLKISISINWLFLLQGLGSIYLKARLRMKFKGSNLSLLKKHWLDNIAILRICSILLITANRLSYSFMHLLKRTT